LARRSVAIDVAKDPTRDGIAPSDRAAVLSFPAPLFLRSSWIKGRTKIREMFAETALDK
jgi:hypothetical protein